MVRPAVVRPGAVADPARLLAFTTQADPVTRGAALCRAGRHDEAAQLLGPVQEAAERELARLRSRAGEG